MREPVFQSVRKLEYSFLVEGIVGNMVRQHYHDGYEVYLQLDGERNVFFNNRKYVLTKGSLFIIEPFVLHMTTNSEDAVCSRNIMNFKSETLGGFLSEKEIDVLGKKLGSCIIQLNEEQMKIIKGLFEEIQMYWHRYLQGEKHCEKLSYMSVYRLLDMALYFKSQLNEIINLQSLEVVTNPEIFRVLKFIAGNYNQEITLDQMVEYSHMSKSSFYRAFKKITGDTFGNYLLRYRLSKAHKLVMETSFSFKDIANRTGFSSTANMTRAFRQQYGIPPSKFRK